MAKRTQQSCGDCIEPRNELQRRGRGRPKGRRQHERSRYARHRRPAGVGDQLTHERIASEPGRPPVARGRYGGLGPGREAQQSEATSEGRRGRTAAYYRGSPEQGRPRRRRRVWREGGRSWGRQAATHVPDSAPDKACHRSGEPAGRECKGRSGLESRSRLTCDRSPVRESRTPGSVGEVPGDRHPYPTQLCGVAERVDDAIAEGGAEFCRLALAPGGEETLLPPELAPNRGERVSEGGPLLAVPSCS
jgi:hypothetical protein